MPWTIIPQIMTTPQGEEVEVAAKRVIIEIENKKRIPDPDTGKVNPTFNIMVGASVFIRNDAWDIEKNPVSMDPAYITGCIKVFYSTPHRTFSVQWPHRIDVCPRTGETKKQEIKTTGLKAAGIRRTLAENNIPAAFIEAVTSLAQTTGTKKDKKAA